MPDHIVKRFVFYENSQIHTGSSLTASCWWGTTSHSYVVLVFTAASFARDSPLSYSEIDPHACAQLHLQQDGLLQQRPLRCQPVSTRPSSIHPWCSSEDRLEDSKFSTSRPAFETSFIGSQFASGPSSRSACSFGTAWSALPRLTSRNSASPFPPAPVVGAFDQRAEGTLWSLERIQLDSGGAVSLCLGRPSGISYRRRFGKPWTMLNCLRKSWKHSTCRSKTNTSEDSYRKSVSRQSINQSMLHATVSLCILNFVEPRVDNLRSECREGNCVMRYRLTLKSCRWLFSRKHLNGVSYSTKLIEQLQSMNYAVPASDMHLLFMHIIRLYGHT